VTRIVAPLVVDYSVSLRLVVDYSASRRLVVDYFASTIGLGALARRAARHAARRAARRRLLHLAQAHRGLLCLRRASECLGTSRGSSRGSSRRSSSTTPRRLGSSSTTLPRAGSSSTTPPRAGSSSTTPPCIGTLSTTSPPPRVRVPRHIARLVTRLVAPLVDDYSASRRLVVKYFASAARPGASAHRAARHAVRRAARRRLLHLAQTHRWLLCLHRASGCLGTSRGSSRSSSRRPSSTTSTTPRVRVTRHVARLITRLAALLVIDYSASRRHVVDYFASAERPGCLGTLRWHVVDYFASATRTGPSVRCAARLADRRAARR
jgi:hypothetical protein